MHVRPRDEQKKPIDYALKFLYREVKFKEAPLMCPLDLSGSHVNMYNLGGGYIAMSV